MVAETDALTKPKSTRGGFRQQVPLPTKLRVRALYVIQQLSYRDIADQVGLPVRAVQNLVYREKWTPVRQRIRSSIQAKADERTRERIQAEVSELGDSVAIQTADLAVGTLVKSRETLARDDVNAARDLQAYSQSAKNFVGIYRQVRELDSELRTDRNGQTLVFVKLERVGDASTAKRLPEPAATEINVTPVLNNSAPDSPKLT